MKDILIKEVITDKELKAFIQFPKKLYKNCPHYVPNFESEDKFTLTKHPAKSFCSLKMFLAYRNNKVVGRVAGIINHKCNQLKGEKRIRFGWFDFIDDIEVAKALLAKVEEWGYHENLLEICGPSRFSNMEKQGMLVEGFDETPPISSEYNYDYYPEYMEALGFKKEVDYVQYKVKVNPVPERIDYLYNLITQKYDIRIKNFKNKKEAIGIAKKFFYTLNASFEGLFNFIPLTDEEIDYLIKSNFSMAQTDLLCLLVDNQDNLVGFNFSISSLANAFRKANGKLFPLGWFYIMKAMKKNDTVNMVLTGILPGWQHSGIHVIYHKLLNEAYLKRGFKYAITNPQLESNPAVRIWNKYEAAPLFRRRCYKKTINR